MLNYGRIVIRRRKTALAASLAASLLAACSTVSGPEYQPKNPGGAVGYSDLELSPNRYMVSFSGSTASSRDDVEKYLLRRSAEITLRSQHTHFVLSKHDTERDTYSYGYGDYLAGPYYYPYGGWYGSSSYWGGYRWPVSAYSAHAEITMLDPEEAARNPEAIDASRLLQRLQPALPFASVEPR